jgi:hypothetical protein
MNSANLFPEIHFRGPTELKNCMAVSFRVGAPRFGPMTTGIIPEFTAPAFYRFQRPDQAFSQFLLSNSCFLPTFPRASGSRHFG